MSRAPHPSLYHSASPLPCAADRKKLRVVLGNRKCRVWMSARGGLESAVRVCWMLRPRGRTQGGAAATQRAAGSVGGFLSSSLLRRGTETSLSVAAQRSYWDKVGWRWMWCKSCRSDDMSWRLCVWHMWSGGYSAKVWVNYQLQQESASSGPSKRRSSRRRHLHICQHLIV